MLLLHPLRIFTVLLFLFSLTASAQNPRFNHWSLEASAGVHVPLAPGDGVSLGDYIGFKQYQLAARYMITDKLGVKGHYAHNSFMNDETGLSLNRFGVEGVANVGKLLKVDYRIQEWVGLLFHTGLGVTFANPSSVEGTDHHGNILVGLTGVVKLNKRFSLLGDLSYIHTLKQHYTYSGQILDPDFNGQSGGFVNFSVGIMFSLGDREYHADWY